MSHTYLHCTRCTATHPADKMSLHCAECGSPLEVWYADEVSPAQTPQPDRWVGPPILLPLHDSSAMVSLGEGNTPCVRLPAVGRSLGLDRLYAKLEFLNPTGSFKDRGSAVVLSVAREHGVTEIVEDSSGNAGASVAAYAARAGIRAHIFVPATAPEVKVQQIKVYGAVAHSIDGPREASTEAAMAYCAERGLVYASHNLSPYFIEGTRTIAYEVGHQLAEDFPRHVVMPVGNGSLFIGAWKGFEEMRDRGLISSMPRFHCIQARAFMPIVAAHGGEEWTPGPGEKTVAGGISVGSPPRMHQALEVLQASNGVALAVADSEILRWQRRLAETEGVYAEPTSAAAFAGLEQLVHRGEIGGDEAVLVPVTGFGLKDTPP